MAETESESLLGYVARWDGLEEQLAEMRRLLERHGSDLDAPGKIKGSGGFRRYSWAELLALVWRVDPTSPCNRSSTGRGVVVYIVEASSTMDTSNNIIGRMKNWHSKAVDRAGPEGQKIFDEAQKSVDERIQRACYERDLDSFTRHFESISHLDDTDRDSDARPGSVLTRNSESLQKTDEGFVMTLLTYLPVGPAGLGAAFRGTRIPVKRDFPSVKGLKTLETYTVDQEKNTIFYTCMAERPPTGEAITRPKHGGEHSPLGDNPIVQRAYVLDLNNGTMTDLTSAVRAEPAEPAEPAEVSPRKAFLAQTFARDSEFSEFFQYLPIGAGLSDQSGDVTSSLNVADLMVLAAKQTSFPAADSSPS